MELPARAVLSNNILRGKCFIRTTAALDALNLTKDDLFAQFGSTAYYGIAAVKGTSCYAKTVDDNSPLVSLNGLNSVMSLADGDIITLVAFVTRTKSTSWTTGQYQVYSLNAPDIDFAVVGECKVVTARSTVYQIVLAGFEGTDRSALRAGDATYEQSNSRIVAARRGSNNFNHNYTFDRVTVHTDKIDSDGNVTSMSSYDQTYTTIYVNPDYIDKREGWLNQISCDALFTDVSLPTISDPSAEFYQITYTIHYVRD